MCLIVDVFVSFLIKAHQPSPPCLSHTILRGFFLFVYVQLTVHTPFNIAGGTPIHWQWGNKDLQTGVIFRRVVDQWALVFASLSVSISYQLPMFSRPLAFFFPYSNRQTLFSLVFVLAILLFACFLNILGFSTKTIHTYISTYFFQNVLIYVCVCMSIDLQIDERDLL